MCSGNRKDFTRIETVGWGCVFTEGVTADSVGKKRVYLVNPSAQFTFLLVILRHKIPGVCDRQRERNIDTEREGEGYRES